METHAKTELGLNLKLNLTRSYYNFCLPHRSLRAPLAESIPTRENGSFKKWQQRTPAMAAGVTEHIWSMKELLMFRVPPFEQVTQTT